MAKTLDPKPGGVLAIILGIGMMVLTWYMVLNEGQYYIIACLIGPLGIVAGIALLALPATKMFQTHEEIRDGMKRVVYDKDKPSTLGYLIMAIGILLGAAQFLFLKFGWF